MGSDQSTHAASPAASSSSSSSSKPRHTDGKNFAYLSPIGSNENISVTSGAGSGAEVNSEDASSNKRLSAPNGSRSNGTRSNGSTEVSPAAETVSTLQAQLQAKVSAHVVSGRFLDASSHLYNSLCLSVRPYVRMSVTTSKNDGNSLHIAINERRSRHQS